MLRIAAPDLVVVHRVGRRRWAPRRRSCRPPARSRRGPPSAPGSSCASRASSPSPGWRPASPCCSARRSARRSSRSSCCTGAACSTTRRSCPRCSARSPATSVYVVATGADLAPVWHLPVTRVASASGDLGWAVAAGVGGALVAVVFTYLTTALRRGARATAGRSSPARRRAASSPRSGSCRRTSLTFGEAQIGEILDKHGGTVAFFLLAALRQARGHLGHALVRVARRLHHPAVLHGRLPRPRLPRHRARPRTRR